jgi:hypothetical protein
MRKAFALKMKRARTAKGGRRRNPARGAREGEAWIVDAMVSYKGARQHPIVQTVMATDMASAKTNYIAHMRREGYAVGKLLSVRRRDQSRARLRGKNPTKAQVKAAAGKLAKRAGALAWAATKGTARVAGKSAKAAAKTAAAEVKESICRPRRKNPKRKKVWTQAMRVAFARKMAKYRKGPRRRLKNRRAISKRITKVFILAERNKKKLWFNGAHFSNRSKAVYFDSIEKAKKKAHELIRQFPILKNYAVSLVAP